MEESSKRRRFPKLVRMVLQALVTRRPPDTALRWEQTRNAAVSADHAVGCERARAGIEGVSGLQQVAEQGPLELQSRGRSRSRRLRLRLNDEEGSAVRIPLDNLGRSTIVGERRTIPVDSVRFGDWLASVRTKPKAREREEAPRALGARWTARK